MIGVAATIVVRVVEGAERPGAAKRHAAAEKGCGGQRGERLGGGRGPAGRGRGRVWAIVGSGELTPPVIGAAA